MIIGVKSQEPVRHVTCKLMGGGSWQPVCLKRSVSACLTPSLRAASVLQMQSAWLKSLQSLEDVSHGLVCPLRPLRVSDAQLVCCNWVMLPTLGVKLERHRKTDVSQRNVAALQRQAAANQIMAILPGVVVQLYRGHVVQRHHAE